MIWKRESLWYYIVWKILWQEVMLGFANQRILMMFMVLITTTLFLHEFNQLCAQFSHCFTVFLCKRINSTTTNMNLISRILYKFHLDLIISYHVCSSWSCQFLLWCMCDNEWEVKLSYAIVNKGTHIYCIDYWLNVWTISIPLHHIEFWIGF